jgi:hypothetical protein
MATIHCGGSGSHSKDAFIPKLLAQRTSHDGLKVLRN